MTVASEMMEPQGVELLPCPFCGGEAAHMRPNEWHDYHRYGCKTTWCPTLPYAATAAGWNVRATLSASKDLDR